MVSLKSSNVTVTFCVICYDADYHLLPDRLDDIKRQTINPDEILVVAGGCEPYIEGIRIYSENARKYAGWARNKGASLAECDIIAFCDADDIIHPGKCQLLKEIFKNKSISAMVHSYYTPLDFYKWDHLDFAVEKATSTSGTNISMPDTPPIAHGCISCRKEVFQLLKYDESLLRGQDGIFCRSLVYHDELNVFYNPTRLIIYIPSSGYNSDPMYFGI